ncbi:hypothetical protein ACQR35_11215 [Pseudarthrobacter sp. J1738]|uniref:hypothetical protein n=1 Tax=unclassified Pseudarthrobacter TaxID=2647000 RepID=UPI003D2CD22E
MRGLILASLPRGGFRLPRRVTTPFITGVFTFEDHPDGTLYTARALHKDKADRDNHLELGFFEGCGAVTEQLAELASSYSRD